MLERLADFGFEMISDWADVEGTAESTLFLFILLSLWSGSMSSIDFEGSLNSSMTSFEDVDESELEEELLTLELET